MQKKVMALAVASILAVPMAAQAGVEIYGKARLSVGSISNDDTTAGADKSKLAVSSHASRLGFKGSEDLGDGLTAVWQIERGIDFTEKSGTSGSDLSTRNTFAGLAGSFGTALLGTHDTPYKIATGSLDPFGDTFADYNAVIDSTHDARSKNVVAYISPSMSGFTLAAAYVTDFADDNLKDTTLGGGNKQQQSAISLAGMYSAGPLYASLAYQSVAETGNTPAGATKADALKGAKLGVGYKVAQFNLGLVYESVDFGASVKQKNTYVSGVMDLGNGMNVKAAVGKKGDMTGVTPSSNTGATFFALGAGKSLSKNTEVYALYTSIKDGVNANAAYGLGVGNQPIGAAASSGTSDAKASALVVGINHNFSSM